MNTALAAEIATDLVWQHCPSDWYWQWSNAKTQFGLCQYARKTIKLSRPLTEINDEDTFRSVVLHEIAHVLAGPDANHGPVWRAHARRLGLKNPGRCTEANEIEYLYIAACPIHGQLRGGRHKMTWSTYHRVCRRCRLPITWTRRDGKPVAVPNPPALRWHTRRYSYR